ncbi:beta family protein [Paenibacillus sp. NPDC057967]|uniref:beta family protein n=1 Tax=Paenibacillus sp. NPDC057967 TaxID=3346293 RepID=UPI0036D89C37
MFDQRHYVPIIKWKRGEQVALEKLPHQIKSQFTPLIEIVPITYDYKNDCPKETIDQHLGDFQDQIQNTWEARIPFFIDLDYLDTSDRMQDGRHPLSYIFDEIRSVEFHGIPVTGSNRDVAYQDEVREINRIDNNGVCIRLTDDDFIGTEQIINTLLTSLDISEAQTDLVIDLGEITTDEVRSSVITTLAVINSISNIHAFRTLTITASAFPSNLSKFVSTGSSGSVPRDEWNVWRTLYANRNRITRIPTFGDYTINSPDLVEMDPRLMQIAAGIRYTGKNDYYIFRGVSVRKAGSGGWGQAQALCQQIVAHPGYSGNLFSWGDTYIFDCANGAASTGTAETWRRVGTNHHITLVVNELANFSWT